MEEKEINERLKLIRFFQNRDYYERAIQINAYEQFDNYLDYYVNHELNPLKYIKIRLKSRFSHKDDGIKGAEALFKQIDPKECICVISPFHKGKKLDGYLKRIEQVDDILIKKYKLIYLDYTNLADRRFSVEQYDDKHIIIHFNSFDTKHLDYIKTIIDKIRKIYIHSIHVLMPDVVNYHLTDIIFNKENRTILDLHGVVSEELKQFDTQERVSLSEYVEEIFLSLSDRIVCMSEAMSDFYINKYGIKKEKLIVMTIMPFDDYDGTCNEKEDHKLPKVVYAGGVQKWQNIDLIKDSITKNLNKYQFKIFTQDSEHLKKEWNDLQNNNLFITSGTAQEIYQEYEDCDFGYLLRDDNIVNNVSCPTKSIEYLRYGIIPILKSDRIGNYREYGLKYVKLEDFNNGVIPDRSERRKMIENNNRILLKIFTQSKEGENVLLHFFD